MGVYYYGDIEGKFWGELMSSNIADCYGKGEITNNHLEAKEKGVEQCILYNFDNREAVLEKLREKMLEAVEICGENKDVCNSCIAKYDDRFKYYGESFFAHLMQLAENKEINPFYISDIVEPILISMQSKLGASCNTQVFGEIFIGLEILECFQREEKCSFWGEIE